MTIEHARALPQETDLWVLTQQREGRVTDEALGLLGEAQGLLGAYPGKGTITAVALGPGSPKALKPLGAWGAHRVILLEDRPATGYDGERLAGLLARLARKETPTCILAAHNTETADLCPRLAALLQTALVTRAVDFSLDRGGGGRAVRPVANGHLFQELRLDPGEGRPLIVSLLPSVLTAEEPDDTAEGALCEASPKAPEAPSTRTRLLETREADPGAMELEASDLVVAGGRGVGRGRAFEVIQELAQVLGGTVGGTRPVIDWRTLPFERQIGQTGKTVAPRLLLACGISGANEFTAGMESAQHVIAVNQDSRARIFRFADLGIVGDLHEILPRLISRLRAIREPGGK